MYDHIGRVADNSADYLKEISGGQPKDGAKLVLFTGLSNCTFYEYLMAFALKLRGYQTLTIVCDANHLFPVCEETPPYPDQAQGHRRTPCTDCMAPKVPLIEKLGLPYVKISAYINDDDFKDLQEKIGTMSQEELYAFKFQGVEVGVSLHTTLKNYYRASDYQDFPGLLDTMRRFLLADAMACLALSRVVAERKPGTVVFRSGTSRVVSAFYQFCTKKNVKAVTWELNVVGGKVLISKNHRALQYDLDRQWTEFADIPLKKWEDALVMSYVTKWRGIYNEATLESPEILRWVVGLTEDKPIVSVFPNVTWDAAVTNRDTIFQDVHDWLHQTVEIARRMPDKYFVFRLHPYGTYGHKGDIDVTMAQLLQGRTDLPDNFRVVPSDSHINSYDLARLSDVCVVYSGTMGWELLFFDKPVIAVAKAHYARKNFCNEPASIEEYEDMLRNHEKLLVLDEAGKEVLKRYIYLLEFRLPTPFWPIWYSRLRPHGDFEFIMRLVHLSELEEGKSLGFDAVCNAIVDDEAADGAFIFSQDKPIPDFNLFEVGCRDEVLDMLNEINKDDPTIRPYIQSVLKQLNTENSEDLDYLLTLLKFYCHRFDLDEFALEFLEQLLEGMPDTKIEEYREPLSACLTETALGTNEVLYKRACLLDRMSLYERAENDLKKLLEDEALNEADRANISSQLANIYRSQDRMGEAVELLRTSLRSLSHFNIT